MELKNEETQSISMEFDLPHAPAKVWRALTEPALLAKWLMATPDFEPLVGKAFTFKAPSGPGWDGTVNCQMQEIEPQKRIRYTWAGGGLEGTVVTWTLTPTATGTRLQLEHAGFRTSKGEARFFVGAKQGWQFMGGQRLGAVLNEMAELAGLS